MTKQEELNLFLSRADDFIDSKYILADIKIVNLLKSIAMSDTMVAIFKNCLSDFDYEKSKKQCFVKSKYLSNDKGIFKMPESSREFLAFTFTLLVNIDAKKTDFSDFLNRYFYEDGSFYSAFSSFIKNMIVPFRDTVKSIMESVIEGKLQDPIDALNEQEERKKREQLQREIEQKRQKELDKKTYANSLKEIKNILINYKEKIKAKKLKDSDDLILLIDMLANVIESTDKDAIIYASTSLKFALNAHRWLFFHGAKKLGSLVKDIINEL